MNDNDVPTMEVGIDMFVNYDEVLKMQSVMDSTEGKIIRNAKAIEQATGGMVKLSGGIVQMTTFGNAATRELESVRRATNRAENAGESMVRQLNRQIETFGKTASEIRDMRVELRAVEAESRGLTELAARLRTAGAEVRRLEAGSRQLPGASNAAKASMQNLGFQVQDFAVQVVGGTSALRAFAMQAPQAAGALTGFGGTLGRVGGFLAGPWGIALTLGTTLAAGFADQMINSAGESDKMTGALNRQTRSVGSLAGAYEDLAAAMNKAGQRSVDALAKAGIALAVAEGENGEYAKAKRAWQAASATLAGSQRVDPEGKGSAPHIRREAAARAEMEYQEKQLGIMRNALSIAKDRWKIAEDIKKTEKETGTVRERGPKIDDESLKKQQKLRDMVQWVADTRIAASANVQKLERDMIQQQQDHWGKEIDVGKQLLKADEDRYSLKQAQEEGERQVLAVQREQLEVYLQQLSVLEQMGGVAGQVAALVGGLHTGNFSGVGGQFGQLLQGVSSSLGKDGWSKVTAKLDSIFGGNGAFAKTMGSVLANAQTGQAAGALASDVFGFKGSSTGGAVGGAIGGALGSALGPVGSIVGSIIGGAIGSAVGGLLKGTKYGYASGMQVNADGSVDYSKVSNSGSRFEAGSAMADTFGQGLAEIAQMLGGGLNSGLNLGSLGMRNKKYIFDPTSGTAADRQTFDTAEEAVAAAIKSALDKGVITGIRTSTQTLLRAGGDLQTALNKAVQFESVFTELKAMTDPVGAAIDTLDKQFAQLRTVFAEAGASAQEYADLEQLYQLKKTEAIKQANSEAEQLSRDRRTLEARILALQGKDLQSVAMLRQIELEQMEASLRPLQQRVWAMEDATAIIEKMQPLVTSLQDYRDTLFGQADGALSYRTALIKLMQTGGFAAGGDATALANLQGVSQDFLTSARNNASSMAQYQRDVAMVARYVNGGIDAAQGQIDVAQATLDATNASVLLLSSIDDTLSAAADAAAISTSSATGSASSTADLGAKIDALRAELEQMRADNNAGHAATAGNTGKLVRTMDNVTAASGGDAIATVPAA